MKWTSFLWILPVFCLVNATTRKVTTEVNPNCGKECEGIVDKCHPNLVYVKADGPEDTLHHVWSTIGRPSFLLLQTQSNSSLKFTWKVLNNMPTPEISFGDSISYSFALVFNKVWEYSDPNDAGSMSGSMENVTAADFGTFCWQNVSDSVQTSEVHSAAGFRANLTSSDTFIYDGILSLELETQGQDGRSEIIPRLLFTSNTSQVRLVLDNLVPQSDSARFAVEISIYASENVTDAVHEIFNLHTVKSMDDEYTPGVFKMLHLLSKGSEDKVFGSFMSWKPVAYTTDKLSVTDSTSTVYYTASRTSIDTTTNSSVAETFLKDNNMDLNGIRFNTSFGNTQDGFYTATKYTQWSFAYGLGVPSDDKLSTLVIAVIASGLGVPMLLIIFSTAYLIWHKLRADKDDLLLSRR